MDMRRLVGGNVRRIRAEKGLTQERFAEISGFSQQYISGLEGGYSLCHMQTVEQVHSRSFGVTAHAEKFA
jgi:transcriptional regulator with XRE-family HTH domain